LSACAPSDGFGASNSERRKHCAENNETHEQNNQITKPSRGFGGTRAKVAAPRQSWAWLIDDTLVSAPQREVCASVLLRKPGFEPGKVLVPTTAARKMWRLATMELVDLARGNVFYVVSVCDGPPQRSCTKPAKLALFVDDRPELR